MSSSREFLDREGPNAEENGPFTEGEALAFAEGFERAANLLGWGQAEVVTKGRGKDKQWFVRCVYEDSDERENDSFYN